MRTSSTPDRAAPRSGVELVRIVPYAYIISDHARADAVKHILNWFEEGEIYSMGMFAAWQFIWSDAAFRSGEQTAELILQKR